MKILVISDLHLCDRRHYDMPDEERLEKLGHFIRQSGTEAVLNLGDTVSRPPLLLDEFATLEAGFGYYLKWRKSFNIPFAECAIKRELEFFSRLMGQEVDQLFELDQHSAIITLLQQLPCRLDLSQEDFVINALEKCQGKTVIIGTHQPFQGSCDHRCHYRFSPGSGAGRRIAADSGAAWHEGRYALRYALSPGSDLRISAYLEGPEK